ncbi:MAG TPA: sugar ABC transporter ATP-binding protein [Fimbriimonadaceae bacterium]|nr:sugar ABC transporter ATP-binding protein [Fimbriimonadaceae bacterium]
MIEARDITKRYPGVVALDDVSLSVQAGEIVGLIGENGAGKSTLIKVLGGLQQPDDGRIFIEGVPVRIAGAAHASKLGIALIHQELCNLDNLDIAGNVLLGREPTKWRVLIDRSEAERRTKALLSRLGLEWDPRTPLNRLSLAQQQMVEIAKALSLQARVLIMDEPTSSLSLTETRRLLEVVRELRDQGVGIIYVSHRLDEIQQIADRVVALRDGRNAGELTQDAISHDAMVRLMVGRPLTRSHSPQAAVGQPRLEVVELRTRRYPQHAASLKVGAGEIVGIAGLVGSGRSELVRAIFGIDQRLEGRVVLDGAPIPPSPRAAIRAGLFLVPEDRRKQGVLTSMPLRQNVTLPDLGRYSTATLIRPRQEARAAESLRDRLRIKAPTVDSVVAGLSGGNQQKVVLAKWLAMKPTCLIFDEPTRGIDIGAREEIYALMRELAQSGVAILMISSELEEVLTISDRLLVLHEGRLAGELPRPEASEEAIMRLAVGNA